MLSYTKQTISILIRLFFFLFMSFIFTHCATVPKEWSTKSAKKNYQVSQISNFNKHSSKPVFYQKGIASYYASSFAGRQTSNGEKYDPKLLTAASLTLPINTIVMVKCISTKRSVIVRINDRGPYSQRRIIDLSEAAAKKIGMYNKGVAKVSVYLLH